MSNDELDIIFGEDSVGDTPEERASTSGREWVRSQDGLALFSGNATGMKLSSAEVLEIFGIDRMREVLEYGSAVLPCSHDEPAASLIRRRTRLGLTQAELAKKAGVTVGELVDAENESTRTSIQVLDKICRTLSIDTRRISFERFH